MKRSTLVASYLAALASLAAPVLAHADNSTLGWSYANAAVGTCSIGGAGCTPASGHPPVYPHIQIDQGFNHNSVAADTDPALGASVASANLGTSTFSAGGASFVAPQLHAFSSGSIPANVFPHSWNYAFTEGVEGYLWNGPDTVISLSTFAGTLHLTSNEQTYGQFAASFALLSDAADGQGPVWSATNNGLFTANCASPGAGGISTTGIVPTGTGAKTINAATLQKCSGTFELQTGHQFYIWSQLEVFDLGGGFIDASQTFSVDFAVNVDAGLKTLITQNAVVVPVDALAVGVPEPATWAMMILGLGAVGGAMRRSRRKVAKLAG